MTRYRQLADAAFTCRRDEKLRRQYLQFSTTDKRLLLQMCGQMSTTQLGVTCCTVYKKRSSAMADGPLDTLVTIEKLAIDG